MRRLILLLCVVVSWQLDAAQCTSVFTDGAGSFSGSSKIEIKSGASIYDSSGVLDFAQIEDESSNSCWPGSCALSGNLTEELSVPTFRNHTTDNKIEIKQNQSGSSGAGDFEEIKIESGGTFTFTEEGGEYIVDTLEVKQNATLVMVAGDYWIRELKLEQGSALNLSGTGTVRIYTELLEVKTTAFVNNGGDSERLVVVSEKEIKLEEDSLIEGYLYAKEKIEVKKRAIVRGALNAEEIKLEEDAQVYFEESNIENGDFGTLCEGEQSTSLISHWPIDVCSLDGSAGEIEDIINGNNGQSVDGANIKAEGKYCQAGDFAGTGQHINIPHDSDFELDDGTISLWFRATDLSHNNDRGHGGMGLFSKDSTGTDNGGYHLTIWVESNGSLYVRHQDLSNSHEITTSSGIVSEDQWHHLVYTFGSGGMKLYLDTNLIGSDSFQGGIGSNPEPIILASNAWGTGDSESAPSDLNDHFMGQIDDVKIYNGALTAALITDLNSEAEGTCQECVVENVLEAYWPIDVCSLSGSSDEVVDSVNGYHGQTIDGANVSEQGKFCNAGEFDGTGPHISIPNQTAFEASQGAISMWFNTPELDHSNSSGQGGQGLISRDSTGFDGGGHLSMWVQSSGAIRVRHQSDSASHEINTASVVSENTWHHLVYTWGTSGMQLYLDGASIGSKSSFTGGLDGNQEPLILAANAWDTGNNEAPAADLHDFFQGKMDDIRFYSNQIDTDTISDLYNQSDYACPSCGEEQLLFYQFEEDEWSVSGDVSDNSDGSNDGTALGSVSPVKPDEEVSCKVLDVPFNDESGDYDAVSTGLDVNSIGNKGTISFWYRSDEAWNSGNERQLLDASTSLGSGNTSKYFHLTLRDDGKIDFRLEDENDKRFSIRSSNAFSYDADEWVHVAVTWDLPNQSMTLHLDGISQSVNADNESSLSSNMGDFNTLYIGDNRSEYFVGSSTENSANGQFDDVRVYNYVQNTSQIAADKDDVTTCNDVDHFRIALDGVGLTCEEESLTIKACADEDCSDVYDEDITVVIQPFGKEIEVTAGAENGVNVDVSYTTAETIALSVFEQGGDGDQYNLLCASDISSDSPTSDNCSMTYSNAGFEIYGASVGSGVPHQIAGANFTDINVRAVKDANGVCVALLEGEKEVDMAFSCDTPASCNVNLEHGNTDISASGTTPVSLNFDDSGVAPLTDLSYLDAGVIDVSISAVVGIDEGDVTITSGQSSVTVIPDALLVTSTTDTNMYAAGRNFSLSISAIGADDDQTVLQNYQPGDEDGLVFKVTRTAPDDEAYADGKLKVDGLEFSSALASSATFTNTGISAFNSGVYSNSNVSYSEMATISLAVQDQDYYGNAIQTQSDFAMGEFIPAYFSVTPNTPVLANTYTTHTHFSYYGRPFGFDQDPSFVITAKNAQGETTQNYRSDADWSWLPDEDELPNMTVADNDYTTDHGMNVEFTSTGSATQEEEEQFGSRTVTITGIEINYVRTTEKIGVASSNLTLTFPSAFFEDDNARYNGNTICHMSTYSDGGACEQEQIDGISGANLRWGRLVLENAFGPETEDKKVPIRVEYYDETAGKFVLNQDDSTQTVLDLTSATYVLDHFDASLPDITGEVTVHDCVGNADIECEFALYNGRSLSFEGIHVTRPIDDDTGEPLRGRFILELEPFNDSSITWDDYLLFDWNDTEAGIGNPSAEVSFGQYRGNDRIIHWREVFN